MTDNPRRDAIRRMGMGLLGGGMALGGVGRNQWPPSGGSAPEPGDSYHPSTPRRDPLHDARERATRPLHDRINELDGNGDNSTLSAWTRMNHPAQHWDVCACKSTSGWFKQCVMRDREKARRRAVATLYEEINKMMHDPLESLDRAAKESIDALLAEVLRG